MINKTWSMDFMSDALANGRRFRVLNIIDDFNREALAVEADYSLPGERVVKVLSELADWKGIPYQIRVDNGPEFISKIFGKWCNLHKVTIMHIQPGKPVQNAYVERFNRLYREDVLDAYLFDTIRQVRVISEKWMEDYNNYHPHKSLGGMSPLDYAAKQAEEMKEKNNIYKEKSNLTLSEKG